MSGSLIVVATPIGNLGDLSPRALAALTTSDVVCCEDTRHTRKLFSANSVATSRLLALHEHNEKNMIVEILRRLDEGQTVALVTDAGTPGVSDPGPLVIAAVIEAGFRVTTVPGPTAAIAALTVSGLKMDRFCIEGFWPRRAADLDERIELLLVEPRTTVFYESPKRIGATLARMAVRLGERRAAVARELTKLHEDVVRGTVSELANYFDGRDVLGEITVVVEGAVLNTDVDDDTIFRELRHNLARGMSVRDSASLVASTLGVSKRRTYEIALAISRELDS